MDSIFFRMHSKPKPTIKTGGAGGGSPRVSRSVCFHLFLGNGFHPPDVVAIVFQMRLDTVSRSASVVVVFQMPLIVVVSNGFENTFLIELN